MDEVTETTENEWLRRFPEQTDESRTLLAEARLVVVAQKLHLQAWHKARESYLVALHEKAPQFMEHYTPRTQRKLKSLLANALEFVEESETSIAFAITYLQLTPEELASCIIGAVQPIDNDEFVLQLLEMALEK